MCRLGLGLGVGQSCVGWMRASHGCKKQPGRARPKIRLANGECFQGKEVQGVLECSPSSRYLLAASALHCSASSISDNCAGPGPAALKICSDICTNIPAEHWLALVLLFSDSPRRVHCIYIVMDVNDLFLIADLLQRPGKKLLQRDGCARCSAET